MDMNTKTIYQYLHGQWTEIIRYLFLINPEDKNSVINDVEGKFNVM